MTTQERKKENASLCIEQNYTSVLTTDTCEMNSSVVGYVNLYYKLLSPKFVFCRNIQFYFSY